MLIVCYPVVTFSLVSEKIKFLVVSSTMATFGPVDFKKVNSLKILFTV